MKRIVSIFKQKGVSVVESLIGLPILVMMILGAGEWARIYEAKTAINHALVVGARSASFNHADPQALASGFSKGLVPYYAPNPTQVNAVELKVTGELASLGDLKILNPTREAFEDFGRTKDGVTYLPFENLSKIGTSVGSKSGLNIQDSNLLKVEVIYGIDLRMPFVKSLITVVGKSMSSPGSVEHTLYSLNKIPIKASTVVRMQSEAHLNNLMVSKDYDPGLIRSNEGLKETLLASGTDTASNTASNGFNSSLTSNFTNIDLSNGFGTSTGSTTYPPINPDNSLTNNFVGGDTGTSSENEGDAEVDEIECTEEVEEPNEEDKGFFASVWDDIVDLGTTALNFIKGFWDGIKSQVADIVNMIIHPVETAKGLYKLAKMFINDFEGTVKLIFADLLKDAQKLAECGAYDKGVILGSWISPAFIVKVAAKLSKFSKLADAIDDVNIELGCPINANSFPGDTLVLMSDGQFKRINEIKVGDSVATRSQDSFFDYNNQVVDVFSHDERHLVEIVSENTRFTTTLEHPLYVQGKGWVEAGDVQVNDVLVSLNGDSIVLSKAYRDSTERVYNFTVQNNANYFVTEQAIWVHNASSTSCGRRIEVDAVDPDTFETELRDKLGNNIELTPGTRNKEIFSKDFLSSYGNAFAGFVGEMLTDRLFVRDLNANRILGVDYKSAANDLNDHFFNYVGRNGIDGIYEKNGVIYIVETKTSGVKEVADINTQNCIMGRLCKTKKGQQMSNDWIENHLNDMIDKGVPGIDDALKRKIMMGLEDSQSTDVVRLYSGVDKNGNNALYEITSKNGSTSEVVRSRVKYSL